MTTIVIDEDVHRSISGFSNVLRFRLGTHCGIIIIRFPSEMSTERINEEVYKGLNEIRDEDMSENLIVVSPGKVRIRRRETS